MPSRNRLPFREGEKKEEIEMETEHKIFLEQLRRSGTTNMFGATPYLEDEFDLPKATARHILCEWMESYNPTDPDYEGI